MKETISLFDDLFSVQETKKYYKEKLERKYQYFIFLLNFYLGNVEAIFTNR
jgi:hypothetical protein